MKFVIYLIIYFSLSCQKKEIITTQFQIVQEKPVAFEIQLANSALSILDSSIVYTPNYVTIKYPNGDVASKTGVCSDVVIRAYRKLNIDLQKEVHEDMKSNFGKYPKIWGLKKTDPNIDHRRVPNLEVFFTRKGKKLTVSVNPTNYKTGEIVTWMINGKLPHIGIVTHKKSLDGKRPMLVHNIGGGQVLEDCLFSYKIVGHYKYGN
jgi:uncharacterized protein